MPITNIETKDTTPQPYSSTDPKLDSVPSHPSEYALCFHPAPEGLDLEAPRKKFAEEAFQKRMKIGEVQDLWYQEGRRLIESFEAGKSAQRQKSAFGADVSLTPEEAEAEIYRITHDVKHPYNNDKCLSADRQAAIAYTNRCYEIKNGQKSTFEGYLDDYHAERREKLGNFESNVRKSTNGVSYREMYGMKSEEPAHDGQEPST